MNPYEIFFICSSSPPTPGVELPKNQVQSYLFGYLSSDSFLVTPNRHQYNHHQHKQKTQDSTAVCVVYGAVDRYGWNEIRSLK